MGWSAVPDYCGVETCESSWTTGWVGATCVGVETSGCEVEGDGGAETG